MGRWGPASGMPIRYDQSRCCAEFAAKERVWQKLRDGLRPGGDYELPTVDEAAAELRAGAKSAKQRAAPQAPDPHPEVVPAIRVLINHKTGMLHRDPPCKQVRDPTLSHYEQATEDRSNLHLYQRCDRCFRTGTVERPVWSNLNGQCSARSSSGADSDSSSVSSSRSSATA